MPRTAQDRRDPGDGRSRPQPVADQDSLVLGKVPRARTPRRQGSCIGGILQHRARDEDHRPAEPPASARTPVHPNCAARLGVAHPVEISRANSVHRPRRRTGTCVQFPSILDPLSSASAIGVATLAGIRLHTAAPSQGCASCPAEPICRAARSAQFTATTKSWRHSLQELLSVHDQRFQKQTRALEKTPLKGTRKSAIP